MAAPKGNKFGKNQGRPKGTPNKATQEAREAIAAFVDGNMHRLNEWLDRIAANDPEAAFKALMSVVEYHIPKLARTEVAGDPKKPLTIKTVDIKSKILKAIPDEELKRLMAEHNDG